jgi:ubiquinone/menaquinone biosynthesis C-methylase UbiE
MTNYDDLAEVYDRRYEQSDYSPVLQLLLDFTRGGKRLLEIGCGTGQWLSELAKAGHDIVGLDPSRNMLRIAMEKSRQPMQRRHSNHRIGSPHWPGPLVDL